MKEALVGPISREQLQTAMEVGDIDTVVVAICDMQGRLMGKRLTADFCLRGGLDHGTHFCQYLLGTDMEMNTPDGYALMHWETGYGDWLAKPDWSTLRVLPWYEKTAVVLANPYDDETDSPVPVAPRNILQRQLGRVDGLGYRPMMASELEFYLFRQSFEDVAAHGFEPSAIRPAGHYNEDYNLLQGWRNESVYRLIRNHMVKAGIPVESSKGEAAVGQHEINFTYTDALPAADQHVLFKHGTKEICMQEGVAVTFMAKPHHAWTGSSGHLHISLWDLDGHCNLFYDPDGSPYGMSALMQSFLAGLLANIRAFSLFVASNVNSYKRYALGSWAPVNAVWSRDNRTAGFRIVGRGQSLRIECRIPGADVNPYLAYSALLAAGLHGVESGLRLPDEFKGNAYASGHAARVPHSLYEAMQTWRESDVVRQSFGDTVTDHYYHMALVEQQAYDAVVTDWERSRYFEQG
ncbi:glutamine synthetase family protein [Alicyclobacillus pomorum]|uniref:glutamine synthetase family protein n=1 Tax=Alicyclobacillus pomorum TaxID=204470 RepID=UPI000422DF4B|nr:glutamine synthetase family protein [Alicyclobacillus pomorum]